MLFVAFFFFFYPSLLVGMRPLELNWLLGWPPEEEINVEKVSPLLETEDANFLLRNAKSSGVLATMSRGRNTNTNNI